MDDTFLKTFTDCLGRTWTVTIDIRNDDRIEAALGVSLVNLVPVTEKANSLDKLGTFMADPHKVFDVFYELIREQAEKQGLDKKGVLAGMDEESSEKMGVAILRAIHDFFRMDAKRQAVLRNVIGLTRKMADQMTRELGKLDVSKIIQIDAASIEQLARETRKKFANGTPDTSESISVVQA